MELYGVRTMWLLTWMLLATSMALATTEDSSAASLLPDRLPSPLHSSDRPSTFHYTSEDTPAPTHPPINIHTFRYTPSRIPNGPQATSRLNTWRPILDSPSPPLRTSDNSPVIPLTLDSFHSLPVTPFRPSSSLPIQDGFSRGPLIPNRLPTPLHNPDTPSVSLPDILSTLSSDGSFSDTTDSLFAFDRIPESSTTSPDVSAHHFTSTNTPFLPYAPLYFPDKLASSFQPSSSSSTTSDSNDSPQISPHAIDSFSSDPFSSDGLPNLPDLHFRIPEGPPTTDQLGTFDMINLEDMGESFPSIFHKLINGDLDLPGSDGSVGDDASEEQDFLAAVIQSAPSTEDDETESQSEVSESTYGEKKSPRSNTKKASEYPKKSLVLLRYKKKKPDAAASESSVDPVAAVVPPTGPTSTTHLKALSKEIEADMSSTVHTSAESSATVHRTAESISTVHRSRQKRFTKHKLRSIVVPLSVFNFLGFLPVRVPGLPYHNDLPSPDYSYYDTAHEVYLPYYRRRKAYRY